MTPDNRTNTPDTAHTSFTGAGTRPRDDSRRRAQKLQHDQRFDALRSLPARRALVVAGYLLLVTATVLALWDPLGEGVLVATPVYLLGFGVNIVLRRVLRNVDAERDEALDERLVAVRNAAHRTAYTIVVVATAAAIVALMFTVGDNVEARHLETLFLGLLLGAGLTPVSLLAWQEREV